MKIKISELNMELQTRKATNREVVEEYAELMKSGKAFPAVKVFRERKNSTPVWLVDGFHRVEAMKLNGVTEVEAEVVYSDFAAALSFALKANAEHGLRRTNEDKRHALEMAWEHREELFKGKEPSKRMLAAECCVSEGTAQNFLKEMRVDNLSTPSPEDDDPTEQNAAKNLKEGKDRFGEVIPEKLLPVFTSDMPAVIRKHLRKAKLMLSKGFQQKDVAAISIGQQVLVNIENALTGVKFNQPFCVCRGCHGEGCGYCRKVGFQTKSQYNSLPREYKVGK